VETLLLEGKLGKIVIEIPESNNYILDVTKADEKDLNFILKELKKIERLIERRKAQKYLVENADKVIGKLEIEETTDEELYLQGDFSYL
jgi:lipopolysaccharide export LptBFGC system permease protein LptF